MDVLVVAELVPGDELYMNHLEAKELVNDLQSQVRQL